MEAIERGASRKYDLGTISGKLSYVQLMAKYLRWVTDPAERELYAQRVAQTSGLPVTRSTCRSGRPPFRRLRKGAPCHGARIPAARRATSCGCWSWTPLSRSRRAGTGSGAPLRGGCPGSSGAPGGPGGADPGETGFPLGEDLPDGVRKLLSAELVLADVSRRRRAGATGGGPFPPDPPAREETEELQEKVRGASGEEASLLFDRVVARSVSWSDWNRNADRDDEVKRRWRGGNSRTASTGWWKKGGRRDTLLTMS